MEQRPGDRSRRDLDDFLVHGFFKSSRAQNAPSTPSTTPSRPVVPPPTESTTWRESSRPTEAMRPAKPPRRAARSWPPGPCVEDEVVALAKEHLAADARVAHLKSHEPPFRGTVDQQPIILESEMSKADATKLHDKLDREARAEDTCERRFVLIPRNDTHSPVRDDDELPRRSYTDPKSPSPSKNDMGARFPGNLDAGPTLGRRRSRQDLPSLQTEMPAYRRSTSAYAYTPTSRTAAMSPRGPASDALLSPDRATAPPYTKGYFDVPANAAPRQPHGSVGTPVAEKRRSGGAPTPRPTTPLLEKRNGAGLDPYGRTKQDGDKLSRPQQLSTEGGTRRSDRTPSAHAYLDPLENPRHRKTSSQSSRRRYSSTDDDSESNSDQRRRRHRHHHHRKNGHTTLHPDSDREHHRSGSAKSSDAKSISRHNSPLASPDISPSQLPPIDRAETLRPANLTAGRDSRRPHSRAVSPLTPLPDLRKGDTLDPPKDAIKSRARSGQRSRQSSPEAAPRTRQAASMPSATVPMPIPTRIDLHSPGDSRRSPKVPQFDDDSRSGARPSPSPKPFWQPPPFQPSENLEKPVGSYRRYSQDLDEGNIPPLPPCPRTAMTREHDDWLTLPRAPSFNICPSCYDSTIAPTEFHGHFVLAPPRPAGKEVVCDFGSQPWYRIAWLLTRKERRRDLNLMSALANLATTVPPCSGKEEAVRKWYSIVDPDTGHLIRNFDVCYCCVKNIETLLPPLKGVFVRTDQNGPPGLPRVCDMRFDSKRFVHYFDALETVADSADGEYDPDLSDLVLLVKRFASVPECPRDQTLTNTCWYIITQLPEFTVCPECFDEVVLPGLEKGKAIPMMFNKSLQRIPMASCQLYSDRMRNIFEKSVQGNDYKGLAVRARERRGKEVEFKRAAERERGRGKVGEKEIRRIEAEWASWE